MAVILPAALEYNFEVIEPMLAELYPVVAGGVLESAAVNSEVRESESARGTIEVFRRWNRELNTLTGGRHPVRIRDLTDTFGRPLVKKSDFDEIAKKALGDGSIIYNPVELRYDDIIRVLEECW
jgi:alcohol dehydrogenase